MIYDVAVLVVIVHAPEPTADGMGRRCGPNTNIVFSRDRCSAGRFAMYVPGASLADRSLPRRQMSECGSSRKPLLDPHSFLIRHMTNNNLVHGCLAQHLCMYNMHVT